MADVFGANTPAQAPVIDGQAGEGTGTEGQNQQTQTQVQTPANLPANWQTEFQTPEEMYTKLKQTEQAYKNIQPAFTKATTELSQLRKAQTQPQVTTQPAQTQQSATQQQGAPVVDMVVEKVQEIVAPMQMQMQLQRLEAEDRETFHEVAPIMTKLFNDDPSLWKVKDPIGTAYRMAQAEYIKQNLNKAVTQQQQANNANTATKQAFNAKQPASVPTNNQPSEADQIKAGILNVTTRKSVFL